MKLKVAGLEIDLVYVFAGVMPIFFYAGKTFSPDINYQQVVFFQIIALLFLAVRQFNKWIGAFIVYECFQALFLPTDAFLRESLFLGMGAMIYHLIAESRWKGKYLPHILTAVLFLNAIFCALQFFRVDVYFMDKNLQSSGLFLLPAFLGMYAAIAGPYLLGWSRAAWVLALICTLFSRSSFCVLGLFAGTAFYLFHQDRKNFKRLFIAGILGCLLFVFVKDMPTGEFGRRLYVWKMVISKAMRTPVWGWGPGQYEKTLFVEMSSGMTGEKRAAYFNVVIKPENEEPLKQMILKIAHDNRVDTTRLEAEHFKWPGGVFKNFRAIADELNGRGLNSYGWQHSHNEFLQVFYNNGLIGVLIMLGYVLSLWRRFESWKINHDYSGTYSGRFTTALMGSFIAFLAVAMVQFPLYLPSVVPLVIVLLAVLDAKLGRVRAKPFIPELIY